MATNLVYENGRKIQLTLNSGISAGDPFVQGYLSGVALTDEDGSAVTVDLGPAVYDLGVAGIDDAGSAAAALHAVGQPVYFTDGDSPQLNLKRSGTFFGYLAETLPATSAESTVNVFLPGPAAPKWGTFLDDLTNASDSSAVASAMGSAAGWLKITVGSSTRYIQLYEDTPT